METINLLKTLQLYEILDATNELRRSWLHEFSLPLELSRREVTFSFEVLQVKIDIDDFLVSLILSTRQNFIANYLWLKVFNQISGSGIIKGQRNN